MMTGCKKHVQTLYVFYELCAVETYLQLYKIIPKLINLNTPKGCILVKITRTFNLAIILIDNIVFAMWEVSDSSCHLLNGIGSMSCYCSRQLILDN